MKFLWSRLNKLWLFLALAIGISISVVQCIVSTSKNILATNSPYTMWISIDGFTFVPTIFFILLPLIASLPASTLLKEDFTNGYFYKLKMGKSIKQILLGYLEIAFMTGFIVIAVPLLFNFLSWFMILPNVKPDNLLNINIGARNFTMLFVSLYYSHPFVHAILSIIFSSLWGGLFAVFAMVTSLWIKNKFAAMCTGLVLQIILLLMNATIHLPYFISYSPADFLRELPGIMTNIYVVVFMTAILLLYCMIMFHLDEKRLAEL